MIIELETTREIVESRSISLYSQERPLLLECGKTIARVNVVYETYGTLNEEGTNAVLICHALTASAHAAGCHSRSDKKPGWWNAVIGPGMAFDTDRYFVICPNILGSCYGTTGPTSTNPLTGQRYGTTFPPITIRDIVTVQKALLDALGIQELVTVCGSSLGGMQVLEWGVMFPEYCKSIIPISTAAQQPAWCIGLNAAARTAIKNDPAWNNGSYDVQPHRGLALARMIGMISYRSVGEFEERFARERTADGDRFDAGNIFQLERYLQYQGDTFVDRFDANTYLLLTHAMDYHDISVGRGPVMDVLSSILARALVIGVSSDIRYPTNFQLALSAQIPGATYACIDSIHGHDAFLIEFDQLNNAIQQFLSKGHRDDFA